MLFSLLHHHLGFATICPNRLLPAAFFWKIKKKNATSTPLVLTNTILIETLQSMLPLRSELTKLLFISFTNEEDKKRKWGNIVI